MIKVLFFGPVAERVGCNQLSLEFQANTSVQQLRDQLQIQYPAAFEIVCLVALNGEHLQDLSTILNDHSEVVFMSKFSGG